MIRPAAPTSSAATPTLLIWAMMRTPAMLMVVVSRIMIAPSSRPFCANAESRYVGKFSSGQVSDPTGEHLMIWKPSQICGRITCQPTATAGIVTICAQR